MKPSEMQRGAIVFDTRSHVDASRCYYMLLDPRSSSGPWPARSVLADTPTLFTLSDVQHLELQPVDPVCNVNLSGLLGKRVALELDWTSVSGKVTEIRSHTFRVGEHVCTVPTALCLQGESYPIHQVKKLVLFDE